MAGLCTTIQETPLSWWRRGEGHEAEAARIDRPVPCRSPARSQARGSRRSAPLDRDRNSLLRARERRSRGSERDAGETARWAACEEGAKADSPGGVIAVASPPLQCNVWPIACPPDTVVPTIPGE